MRLIRSIPLFTAVFAVSAASMARAEDFDVAPSVSAGHIVTSAFNDDDETLINNVRVFAYEFGETPGQPYFAEDPGFHPQAGASGFTSDSSINIELAAPLRYWSGSGTPSFATVASGESMQFGYGEPPQTITSSSPSVGSPAPSLTLGGVDANGEFDRHLDSYLIGNSGTEANPGTPAAGFYLATIKLTTDQANVGASDLTYLLFGNGVSDEALEGATVAVRDAFAPDSAVVPEPMSMALFAAFPTIGLMRRRR